MTLWTPRPWQPPMLAHIAEHERCLVFAAMGSGKTVATLTAAASDDLIYGGPTLIVAPKRVALNTWPDEIRKWDHLKGLEMSPILGSVEQRLKALKRDVPVYAVNYDNLVWLTKHYGNAWPFRSVVADESTRLKGYRSSQGGARARALSANAHSKVRKFVGLTGTPVPNGYQNLWGQMWFVDKGQRLGRTYDAFHQRWFRLKHGSDSRHGQYELAHEACRAEIDERIKDVCITIDPKDYGLDVAEVVDVPVYVDLPTRARAHYREVERLFFTELRNGEVSAVNAGVKSGKLLQMANGAVYHSTEEKTWESVHDEKLDALESIVEEANGAPVLVAYSYKHDLARIMARFAAARILDDRKATEDEWNAGRIPILLAHPASAGHGLNLQFGGNILVEFGQQWDMELRDQIIERIGPLRQYQAGLDRPVYRYSIIARGTVDEDVLWRHEAKASVQDALLEAMKRRMI